MNKGDADLSLRYATAATRRKKTGGRETDRQTETERERETHTHTHARAQTRKRDRQTDRDTERQRQRNREKEKALVKEEIVFNAQSAITVIRG